LSIGHLPGRRISGLIVLALVPAVYGLNKKAAKAEADNKGIGIDANNGDRLMKLNTGIHPGLGACVGQVSWQV
jgi:hypothetical protein